MENNLIPEAVVGSPEIPTIEQKPKKAKAQKAQKILACPVCGSALSSPAFMKEDQPFHDCQICNSVFSEQVPDCLKYKVPENPGYAEPCLMYDPSGDYMELDKHFKTVVLGNVIPFIADLPTVMGEIHSLLDEGGEMIVISKYRSRRDYEQLQKAPDFQDGHCSIPDLEGIVLAASQAGFNLVEHSIHQPLIFRKA